jgi:sulfite exporter TauE/SafE
VAALIVLVVITGLTVGLIPTDVFSAAVEAAGDQRQGEEAMAVIMVGQSAGTLRGLVVFGTLVEAASRSSAFASLAVMLALGPLAGSLARAR